MSNQVLSRTGQFLTRPVPLKLRIGQFATRSSPEVVDLGPPREPTWTIPNHSGPPLALLVNSKPGLFWKWSVSNHIRFGIG